jgi:hypothetical protein
MRFLFFGLVLSTLVACKLDIPSVDLAQFADPTAVPITPGRIDEASGIADSRSMSGNLWVEQDGGNPANMTLLGYDGTIRGTVAINAPNRDWEEMAMGPGPTAGVNYIYMGDIGDNNGNTPILQIYRFAEPTAVNTTVTQFERINFRYPDGPRDAEAMFVDPTTKDIYIISKREPNVHLYRLPYPQNINEVTVAELLGTMNMTFVTGAAISPDGSELLVRTYTEVRYWKRDSGQSIADALQRGNSRTLPYRVEPQGEAVCFNRDASGYFTLSERANAASVNLYYYARK